MVPGAESGSDGARWRPMAARRVVRLRVRRRPVARAAAGCLVLLAGLGAAAPAAWSASRGTSAAAGCAGWTVAQPLNPGSDNRLRGVAVLSSTNAWAVGSYDPLNGDPTSHLIEHWDGTKWTAVGFAGGVLTGVAAISRTNVWVVGYSFFRGYHALIEHWDGTGWKVVAVPRHSGILYGVAAVSAADIWAVGELGALHWNGTAWKRVPTPAPGGVLLAVAASSPTHVWAVGYRGGTPSKTLVLRWNGTSWKHLASPNPAGTAAANLNVLDGVTAINRHNVWAVGYDASVTNGPRNTLIEHWNGRRWKHVPSPNPGDSNGTLGNILAGVAASSASNVWAVGQYESAGSGVLTLTARWNGTAWKQVPSPNPSVAGFTANYLYAVAAASPDNVWAVGVAVTRALALHRC